MKKLLMVFAALLFSQLVFAGELQILSVSGGSTVPAAIYTGDVVAVTFNIKNVSGVGQNADDVLASANLNENDFEPIKISEQLGSIKAGSSKTISFRFRVRESALPGHYKIPVSLSYRNGSTKLVQSEEVGFGVSSCTSLKVDGISLSSVKPHIGETLEVRAFVENVCSASARNVTVELKPVSNPTVSPFIVSTGTVRKIGHIAIGERKEVSFALVVGDNVDAKTYVFSIDANCDGCSKVFSNSFSFLVLGKPSMVFSNIEYSVDDAIGNDKHLLQGSIFTFSVQLDNIGEEKAKKVSVSIDFGNSGINGPSRAFVGNINPDDSGAAVFNLSVAQGAPVGEHAGLITVSYLDELGQEAQLADSYSLYVNPQPPVGPLVYIVILVLIAVVLGLVYFIVKFVFRQLAIRAQSR